jgi:hypothetical protein
VRSCCCHSAGNSSYKRTVDHGKMLVRDLDASAVEKLKARAAANGRSLQAELKAFLEEQASQVTKGEARAGCPHPAAHWYGPPNR